MYGTVLQPAEPPGQGKREGFVKKCYLSSRGTQRPLVSVGWEAPDSLYRGWSVGQSGPSIRMDGPHMSQLNPGLKSPGPCPAQRDRDGGRPCLPLRPRLPPPPPSPHPPLLLLFNSRLDDLSGPVTQWLRVSRKSPKGGFALENFMKMVTVMTSWLWEVSRPVPPPSPPRGGESGLRWRRRTAINLV